MSLGPRLNGEICKNIRIGMGLGLALNVADWSASYEETLNVRSNGGAAHAIKSWKSSESGTDVLPGFYIETTVQVELTSRISTYVGGRYDWSQGMDEKVGPSHVQFEPGGWTAMLGLTIKL